MFFKNLDYAAGWLAGIIDGEGCVSRTGIKQRSIQISNTDLEIVRGIEEALSMFSINYNVSVTHNRKLNPKHHECYSVKITNRDGLERINQLLNLASEKKSFRLRHIIDYYSKTPRPVVFDPVEACELYLAGASCKDLANKYGTDPRRVFTVLRRCGIITRTVSEAMQIVGLKRRKIRVNESELVRLYRSGLSIGDAGKAMGLKKGSARDILMRNGISITRSEATKRSWAKRDKDKWKVSIGSASQAYWKQRREAKELELQSRN